jgi:hypothetical protein
MDHIKLNEEEYNLLLNIFIICSKRGVFQIDEYKIIGELYERIKKLK